MERILVLLITLRVQAMWGRPLTERDKSVIARQGIGEAKRLLADLDKVAKRILQERIVQRYPDENREKNLHTYTGSRPKR